MKNTMSDLENKITTLEETLAHLAMSNEELSCELIHRTKRIEALERKVAMLESRFATLEDNMDAPPEDTRPPHW